MLQRRRLVPLAAAALLAGCASGGSSAERGDCPTRPLRVVVSVAPWTDMVRALGGDCADVRTIVTGSTGDPHDYEPTPSDAAAISEADVTVVNGLGYDTWATGVAAASGRTRLVDIGRTTDQPADADPHLWYDPSVLEPAADAVSAALQAERSSAASWFAVRRAAWTSSLAPYRSALDTAQRALEGRDYAATEPVGSRLARFLRMNDRTPSGFVRAAGNDTEPPPSDVAALDALVRSKQVALLMVNPQTSGPVPDAVRRRAESVGVPVVELRETPPAGRSWTQWQVAQLAALTKAAR